MLAQIFKTYYKCARVALDSAGPHSRFFDEREPERVWTFGLNDLLRHVSHLRQREGEKSEEADKLVDRYAPHNRCRFTIAGTEVRPLWKSKGISDEFCWLVGGWHSDMRGK